jgi:hypothetical protein
VKIQGYRPSNRWLERQLDQRWRSWLTRCLGGAALVGLSLAVVVGPRQTLVRTRYEIAQINQEIDRLEDERRTLLLEREALTSPSELAAETAKLDLTIVPHDRVAYLTTDGRLLLPPTPPPPAHRTAAEHD